MCNTHIHKNEQEESGETEVGFGLTKSDNENTNEDLRAGMARPLDNATIANIQFINHEHPNITETMDETETMDWTESEMNAIKDGIAAAIVKLNRAEGLFANKIQQLSPESKKHRTRIERKLKTFEAIISWIRDVRKVLNSGLNIYRLFAEDEAGAAMKKNREISINLELNKGPMELQKTLIHEAFHIIGGCITVDEFPFSDSGEQALRNIMSVFSDCNFNAKAALDTVQADCFAQLVRECENIFSAD